MKLVSVVLSGGAGTRLWPASRQAYPKPFMKFGGSSLLAQAILRGQSCGTDELLVVTNEEYQTLTRAEVDQLPGAPHVHLMLEPQGRNTAPAIAVAALHCSYAFGPSTVMMVLPADHLVTDNRAFVACASEAATLAQSGQLVVFGIEPTAPDTGFGYIEVQQRSRVPQKVLRFVEKPDLPTAQSYLAQGRFFWNSGMFCFTAETLINSLAQHAPQVLDAAREAMKTARHSADATHLDPHTFGLQPEVSIDYALMEKATNVTVVPARFDWSDVGSWPAVADSQPADASGNTFLADVVGVDTHGTHVQIESHGPKVVATLGVTDLVIVDTPDALLVAHKASAPRMKMVVDALKARSHPSTKTSTATRRSWGTYVTLKEEPGCKVRRVTIKPGESQPLHYHLHRTEHWVVVDGLALVQVGDEQVQLENGQYRCATRNVKHRLANIGTEDLILMEVQSGAYLGDDDVVHLSSSEGRDPWTS